jgi:tetratricopeptide (TPR) repeat protein
MSLLLLSLSAFVRALRQLEQDPIKKIEQMISFNKFWDAYKIATTLVAQRNESSKVYLLRAQCASRMEMPAECISDCSKVVDGNSTKNEIREALILRATAFLQLGDFELADADSKAADDRKTTRRVQDALRLLSEAETHISTGELNEARKSIDRLLRISPKSLRALQLRADLAWAENDHNKFLQTSTDLAQHFPNDSVLHFRHGVALMCSDQLNASRSSIEISLQSDGSSENTTTALNIVTGLIDMRRVFDCETDWNQNLQNSLQFCANRSPLVQNLTVAALKYFRRRNNTAEIVHYLTKVIEFDPPNSASLLVERGEANIALGLFDNAIYDFNLVLGQGKKNDRAMAGYDRAYQLKKAARRVDYYGVLNITSRAGSNEIQAAYKKLVRYWHPDRFPEPAEKQQAERQMKEINTAYEILTDPEKKAIFDAGGDPEELEEAKLAYEQYQRFMQMYGVPPDL